MIEKVFGINATNITLDTRFTLLAALVPKRVMRPRKFLVLQPLANKSNNFRSQNVSQERIYHVQHNNRQMVKQRPALQYQGVKPRLQGVKNTNNINRLRLKRRLVWHYSNGNLRPFSNASGVPHGYGFRMQGPRRLASGYVRGRGGHQQVGKLNRVQTQQGNVQNTKRGRFVAQTGRGRGAKTAKKIPTKEELDLQLESYMANTPWALDKQLDDYMKEAMNEE